MRTISEYKLVDGEMKFVNREMTAEEAAMPQFEEIEEEPTQLDKIEAQVLYTALMTDTLIEGE